MIFSRYVTFTHVFKPATFVSSFMNQLCDLNKIIHKPAKRLESLQDQTKVQKVCIFCPSVAPPSKVHTLGLLPVQEDTSDCI